MTCGFCKYEFCWVCGESATNAENHFGITRGCGTMMMDETAKPGDHLNRERGYLNRQKCAERKRIAWLVLKIVLCVLFSPLIFVLILPVMLTYEDW